MASPIPDRPLRRPKRAEKPPKRNPTSKEQRRKKTQNIVTWGLAFVFAITSVGFMIGFGSGDSRGAKAGPQSEVQVLQERLKAEQEAAAAHPDQPQYHYSQATTYQQMAGAAETEGKADDAKGYQAKALEQLRETLKVSPGHLPALKDLAAYDVSEGKYQDAVDILTAGIKAEKDDIARRKTTAAASPAPSDQPVIQPDVDLRALLFAAYASLPGKDALAEETAREGLALNPKEFVGGRFGVGLTVMVLHAKNQPEAAMRAAEIALKAATAINDKESAAQLQKMIGQMIVAKAQAAAKGSPAPSGAPAVGASPGAVVQTPPPPGPAPSPSGEPGAVAPPVPPASSPAAPPAESAVPPAPPAQPAPAGAPSTGTDAGMPPGAPVAPPASPAAPTP